MKSICFFTTAVVLQIIYIKREKIAGKCASAYNRLLYLLGKEPTSPIETRTPTDIYVEQHMHRFLKSYDSECKYSENIADCFYKKDTLTAALVDANNPVESEWRRRLLYESTPRGNIIMYYDPYKLGFVYYSDTNTISPRILNAAAMKYAIAYRCRDFFVDNSITPDGHHSSLIPIHFIEQPKPTDANVDKTSAPKLDNTAFAKFKNYSKQIEKPHPNHKPGAVISPLQPKPMPWMDICKNRFIYMGKTNNIQLTQPVKKNKNKLNGFSSTHIDNLKGETQLQSRVVSYKDFKRETSNT
jgi:hypothetical protein